LPGHDKEVEVVDFGSGASLVAGQDFEKLPGGRANAPFYLGNIGFA